MVQCEEVEKRHEHENYGRGLLLETLLCLQAQTLSALAISEEQSNRNKFLASIEKFVRNAGTFLHSLSIQPSLFNLFVKNITSSFYLINVIFLFETEA